MELLNCHTLKEILHQPKMWEETFAIVNTQRKELGDFFKKQISIPGTEIIFTGAGTSAFVADIATALYTRLGLTNTRSVPTTDIVSSPDYCLTAGRKLVVSFARSGDSPESVAAYNIVRKVCPGSSHLIITCNPNGYLARIADPEMDYALILPDGTNDRSLAMTSSFSSMLLASLLARGTDTLDEEGKKLGEAIRFAERLLQEDSLEKLQSLTGRNVSRAVFLGSGPLKGVACECHLKLQELTDGAIMCSYDSFMGLRHGPKAVIKDNTLVVYLLSDKPYTRQYELDLIRQVGLQHRPAGQVIVSTVPSGYDGEGIDFELNAGSSEALPAAGPYRYIPYVIVGQLLGYFFSVAHGLSPDNPSVSHTISRVVSGVHIYDFE